MGEVMQPQIDYAPALPGQKRRRRIRHVAVGVVALLVAVLILKTVPRAWRHLQILYWQRQAMGYDAPVDQIVYDDEPMEASRLLSAKGKMIAGSGGSALLFAEPWNQFYRLVSPPGPMPAATLFLHERRNSKGERRLVVVQERSILWSGLFAVSIASPTPKQPVAIGGAVFVPGSAFSTPTEVGTDRPWVTVPTRSIVLPIHFRWYAGQADPRDDSHFTIRGLMDGNPITVDGWLRDDDRLEFQSTP